jgi:hypothetical protein
MAGMRPFVLREKIASAYCDALAAADCPSSQIAIDKLSAVPLWKVIVGPAPTNLQTGPARVRFSFFVLPAHTGGEWCANFGFVALGVHVFESR